MYERILIPLDGSHKAAEALPYAVSFVRAFDATCTLLAVVPRRSAVQPELVAASTAGAGTGSAPAAEDGWFAAEDWLVEARDHLLQDEWIPASLEVREGNPAAEIVKFAQEGKFDLIVLTVFGQGATANPDRAPVIGSVADEVLRFATVPVLVIHPTS